MSAAPVEPAGCARAGALAAQLESAGAALVALLSAIDAEQWVRVPAAGVWSVGKEAEHVADGNVYHRWIVRSSVGLKAGPRPPIERARLTALGAQQAVIEQLEACTRASVELIRPLTDAQLDLPTRPPRARSGTVVDVIEAVLIGHYNGHRREIEAKLGRPVTQP